MIKAIETVYKGYRFRSRLEARWAVFFDALGIKWEYETEGFDLEEFGRYLPDFTICNGYGEAKCWIEIKGHRNLNSREYNVAHALREHLSGYILFGTPEVPMYHGPESDQTPVTLFPNGFVTLTPNGAPEPEWDWYTGSWAIEFGKVVSTPEGVGKISYLLSIARLCCWHEWKDFSVDFWPVPSFEPYLIDEYGTGNPLKAGTKRMDSPRLRAAYADARQARFEHGESG